MNSSAGWDVFKWQTVAAGNRCLLRRRKITASEEAPITRGNRLPLKNIPTGTTIHAIELQPGKGAQLVRSAGASAQLVAKENDYAQVRLPSGEIRLVRLSATASI